MPDRNSWPHNRDPGHLVAAPGEAFVPLHITDLVEFLSLHPALNGEDVTRFRQLADIVLSLLHHIYRQRHQSLTYAYAPLDPDRDTRLRHVPTSAHRDDLTDELFRRTGEVLARANYRVLDAVDIQNALQAASQWGVRMRVDFSKLQRMEVYARGASVGQRIRRRWQNLFKPEIVDVPLYQRLVVIFRTQPSHKSTERFDPRRVYLRMFKNVPQQDVDMMLPATGIQMTWLDHSRIVLPSMYAVAMTLWRILRNVLLLTLVGIFKTFAMIVIVLFAIGFGLKSMFTYTVNTRRRYLLNMAQNLYYQNLDNNAGVLMRLLEDAEQQEACETVLTYFVAAILLAKRSNVQLEDLANACQQLILQATGVEVKFDIEAAAHNLVHLGILTSKRGMWTAPPTVEALQQLNRTWDSWFNSDNT